MEGMSGGEKGGNLEDAGETEARAGQPSAERNAADWMESYFYVFFFFPIRASSFPFEERTKKGRPDFDSAAQPSYFWFGFARLPSSPSTSHSFFFYFILRSAPSASREL